jgi:protein-tyrosine phosphatase
MQNAQVSMQNEEKASAADRSLFRSAFSILRSALSNVWLSFAVFMLLMVAGTFTVYWYNNIQVYHLGAVQVGVLYRDGNRDLREFKHSLTFTQAKTVVSLIDDNELNDPAKPQFLQETNYCTGKLIQYIRIPVPLGGWPTSDDLKNFIAIVSKPENQPVLVHCAQGVRRTGMFVAAYQMSVMHETKQQALEQIRGFGHKAKDTDDIRQFIAEYDPVTQTLPVKERVRQNE